ncbi:MAG: M12 family metallo-peptidase [candidate division Zixibacteria bacterium]|nr:M12 family metallo-peptidase [candidate division Zixibacteria bacterium]
MNAANSALTLICLVFIHSSQASPIKTTFSATTAHSFRPFTVANESIGQVELAASANLYHDAVTGNSSRLLELPTGSNSVLTLELERTIITTPDARFFSNLNRIQSPLSAPEVQLFTGQIQSEPNSLVYFSVSSDGIVNGFVDRSGGLDYSMSSDMNQFEKSSFPPVIVKEMLSGFELPEGVSVCGLSEDLSVLPRRDFSSASSVTAAGVRLARVAIDADSAFVAIFPDQTAAAAYIVQLLGAVSAIYTRDINLRLALDFVRLWPNGGEPFSAADIGGFRDYWVANEDTSGLHLTHLFSGRRGLPYGGIAFLSGTCGSFAYGIDGFLNGSFASPVVSPDNGNWDIIVTAHEMGHNLGTGHTHDAQYDPHIDDCGNGIASRGTIMSYCHTYPGYIMNTDMHMHRRVEAIVDSQIMTAGCHPFDCNENNIDDAQDIELATSSDGNFNGIPDECEDCNNNGMLDPLDIVNGFSDINLNGVLDVCEQNCNANSLPDEMEIRLGTVTDDDGNNLPDNCDPDCDGDLVPDFAEIVTDLSIDIDRNTIPDDCQDCNQNSQTDFLDMQRQFNLFVSDRDAGYLREYHRASGVGIQTLADISLAAPLGVAIGLDRSIFVADVAAQSVMKINPYTSSASVFTSGATLLGPSALVFAGNGDLLVSDTGSNSIKRFNGVTGAYLSDFVSSGSGGLSNPFALIFGPNGNLFVASSSNAVLQYDGGTGTFIGSFVTSGSGGLNGPRGLAFRPSDNHLLVGSYWGNEILEYSSSGTFVQKFNDTVELTNPWSIAVGPNGNLFVVRSGGGVPRVLEYVMSNGRYYRAFVRGDVNLVSPSGLAFMPGSAYDCNQNMRLDFCDIAVNYSMDSDNNGIPDECVFTSCCVNSTGNVDCDLSEATDISDLTLLIDHLFISLSPLCCSAEANIDGDNQQVIDIADLTSLIDHLFISLVPTSLCQ